MLKPISILFCVLLVASVVTAHAVSQDSAPKGPPPKTDQMARLTIEVSGGDSATPIENASVYIKYVEERKLKRDKQLEMNVKTNQEGIAHIPAAPMGKVLIQVVADGWKSYGRWIDVTELKQTIKIHLEKPPRWY